MNEQGIRLVIYLADRVCAVALTICKSLGVAVARVCRPPLPPPIADLICVIDSLHRSAIDQDDPRRRSDPRRLLGSRAEPRLPEECQGRPSVTNVPRRSAQA